MSTPVILVCVHDLEESLTVNHDMLYSMFSSYGTIQRILIFERSNTLKSFIEFDNAQSALEARKKLNRAMLFDDRYRISIYPSNLPAIKFQNNFPGGMDYTLLRKQQCFDNMGNMQQTFMQPMMMTPETYYNDNYLRCQMKPAMRRIKKQSGSSSPSNHNSEHEGSFDEDDILRRVNCHQKETKVYDSETADVGSDRDDNEAEDFNHMINAFSSHVVFDGIKNDSFSFNQSFQDKRFNDSSSCSFLRSNRRLPSFCNHSMSSATNSEHSLSRLYSMEELPNVLDWSDEKASQPVHSAVEDHSESNISSDKVNQTAAVEKTEEEEKMSPVLHVLGIESKEVNTRMLFNVFSNFGNILKLMFIKTRAVALIEFEKVSAAKLAKDSLNTISFMGKPFRITFSKYQTIQLEPGQNEKYPDQLILGDENNSRFKDGKNAVAAVPSTTLHISNLSKEVCKDKKMISNYLGAYGEIKAVKLLLGDNGKNMCLVKMKSVEECLQVMAHLHDTELGGRKIQISFSRSKI